VPIFRLYITRYINAQDSVLPWTFRKTMTVSEHQGSERTSTVKPLEHSLTDAQLALVRAAAARPNQALEPLPYRIKGAAWQAVVDALVTRG
jgi:hypothetical protein